MELGHFDEDAIRQDRKRTVALLLLVGIRVREVSVRFHERTDVDTLVVEARTVRQRLRGGIVKESAQQIVRHFVEESVRNESKKFGGELVG
ncbi:MAG: hypothetical protein IID39_02490 [Planctomycetes bacterium]|nr:hypothetical protein [Planctomycetota bacterium]